MRNVREAYCEIPVSHSTPAWHMSLPHTLQFDTQPVFVLLIMRHNSNDTYTGIVIVIDISPNLSRALLPVEVMISVTAGDRYLTNHLP